MRVLDAERLPHQVVNEIEGGTRHKANRHLIHQDSGAVLLESQVVRGLVLVDLEFILKTGATPAIDGYAQCRWVIRRDITDAGGGTGGNGEGRFGHGANVGSRT